MGEEIQKLKVHNAPNRCPYCKDVISDLKGDRGLRGLRRSASRGLSSRVRSLRHLRESRRLHQVLVAWKEGELPGLE